MLRGAVPVLLICCLAAAGGGGAAGAGTRDGGAAGSASTQLATLAAAGDVVPLWRAATEAAAAAVVRALEEQASGSVELQGIDLDELRIWHGQTVSLGLEADRGQPYKYVVQSEPEWRRLRDVLPAAQGGLLSRGSSDWDRVDRDWLSPVARGSLLPDFALEGPVDVYLAQPTALSLYLPHASDAGLVRRVLLRQGAAVMVRGARAVRLRRGVDLPPISLGEFASIATSDAEQQQPLGVLHLLQGVQREAARRWNESHPAQSLGLVALELELAPSGAALLAAPTAGGGARRLRVKPAGSPGVIELLARDSPAAAADDSAVALPSSAAQAGEAAWPLTSVHPSQLQAYERLLRQIISSRLFQSARAPSSRAGGKQQRPPTLRVAKDVQLRLTQTEAEATTLLQMQLDLVRRPAGAGGKGAKQHGSSGAGGPAAAGERAQEQQQQQQQGGAEGGRLLAVMSEPPDAMQVAATAGARLGPHETWTATVQVKGDARRGNLRFEPLMLQRVGAAHDTVQLAPSGLLSLFGGGRNDTELLVIP